MDLANTGLGVPNLPAPDVQCDLCGGVMTIPQHCVEQNEIVGLLTCSQCREDELCSRVGFYAS